MPDRDDDLRDEYAREINEERVARTRRVKARRACPECRQAGGCAPNCPGGY